MKEDELTNDGVSETMFTKPFRDGQIEYIEREVDRFNYENFEVVRRELFSKANCPAVTFREGKIIFNIRAIRKLNECSHVQILLSVEQKQMIAKPCDEDEKDSVQWSKIDKHGKVIPRPILGRSFSAQLFNEMRWDFEGTFKILGTLIKSKFKNEMLFVFELINAEMYENTSRQNPDEPNRRDRVPLMPLHWQGRYGLSYEENQKKKITTFEDAPENFMKITFPQPSSKKLNIGKINKKKKGNSADETGATV